MEYKLLPKPSVYAYIAECSRIPGKIQVYAAKHLWQTFAFFFLWCAFIAYITVPKIYQSLVLTATRSAVGGDVSLSSYFEMENNSVSIPTTTLLSLSAQGSAVSSLVPVELKIPKLTIQTNIEQVGQTKTHEMDVPKNAANVAWYVYGAKPGEEGNAVISGHYDTPSGKPAVFYKLKTLVDGDEVTVISEDGTETRFVVTGKEVHSYKNFPSEYVFFTKPGKNLNLITCGGIWDVHDKIYNERLVVYTQLKE
jgi:sortase (surface protein transpeptidase)